MRILYVTSETNPFAASGGLGDVMGALPKAVASVGNVCEVIMPLYNTMKEQYRARLELVCDMSFKFSWRDTGASVYKLTEGGVTYYFVENHYYFDRGRLYGEFDDGERKCVHRLHLEAAMGARRHSSTELAGEIGIFLGALRVFGLLSAKLFSGDDGRCPRRAH